MGVEKSVRRARQNYINALRQLQRERGLVVTRIDVIRIEVPSSSNEFHIETRLDVIGEQTESIDNYLFKKQKEYIERFYNGFVGEP
jgi:hypothetical protein